MGLLCQVLGGIYLIHLITVRMNLIFIFQILLAMVLVSPSQTSPAYGNGLAVAAAPDGSIVGYCIARDIGDRCKVTIDACNGRIPMVGLPPGCTCRCGPRS